MDLGLLFAMTAEKYFIILLAKFRRRDPAFFLPQAEKTRLI